MDGDIAQVTPTQLTVFINKLNNVVLSKERKTHTELLEQIETIKDNKQLPDLAKQQLQYLFAQYTNGSKSSTELVTLLADHKLFSFKDNKLDIDPNNPLLTQRLTDVLESVDLSLKGNAEASIIEGNVIAYRTGFSKRSEVEIYDNTSKASFISEYNLSKDYDFVSKDRKTIIKDAYLEQGDRKIKFDDMDSNQQFEMLMDMTKVLNNTTQSKRITRLFAVEGYGVFSDMDYQVYDNSLFRYLDNAAGFAKSKSELNALKLSKEKEIKDIDADATMGAVQKAATKKVVKLELDKINRDIATGGDKLGVAYSIVDLNLQTNKNSVSNAIKDNVSMDKILNLLNHNHTEAYINKDLRPDYDNNKLPYEASEGSIMIQIGDLGFGIAISKKDLPNFAKQYAKTISGWKKTYSDKQSLEVIKNYEKTFNNLFEKQNGQYIVKDKSVGNVGEYLKGQASELQTLITADFMDKNLGKWWWEHSIETLGGKNPKEVAKLFKRIRLMANLSMKEISNKHIDGTIDLLKTYKKDQQGIELTKDLQNFKKNDGMDIMIAADEGGQSSVLKALKEQIDKSIENNKILKNETPIFGEKDGELTLFEGKDLSQVDSYMAVDATTMRALYGLMGTSNVSGLGGIKPIIHRLGANPLLGKTAFVRDPKMDAFLKKNKISAILFESGNKINYNRERTNVFKDWSKLEDFHVKEDGSVLEVGRMDLYREHLQPKDISLGAVVNSDHNASIPFQALNHISREATPAAYDWLVRKNINDFNQMGEQLFSSSDFTQSIAMAKYLNQSKAVRDSESAYSMFINANGMPTGPLFADNFIGQLKSKFLDKGVLKMETTRGGQAVASPGTNLRNTWMTNDGKVYDYGEIALPNVSGGKLISKERLSLINHKKSAKDELIKGTDILTDLTNKTTLKEAFDMLEVYNKANKTKYQIAVVARRNPNTRPGDQPIVGLKEILEFDYGNTVKLNAYDTAMRIEGDYDVDKLDFWWDTPREVIKEWDKLSGEVLRVLQEAESKRTSLINDNKGISWEDSNSMNNHARHIAYTERLRGVTVKMQRLMAALKNYDSFSGDLMQGDGKGGFKNIKGLAISRGKDKGYIYLDEGRIKQSYQLLAEDIQRVTDSYAGFNEQVYNLDNYVRNFLFGDNKGANSRYKGLFLKAEFDKKLNRVVPNGNRTHKLNEIEKDILLEAINPYRDMLQLGTSLYSNGREQSVRFQDIISNMKMFDGKMKYLDNNAKKNLKRKGYTNKQLEPYFESGQPVFGEFGTKIRPNFARPSDADFSNHLIFERILSKLAYNDKMQLEKLSGLQGSKLREYQEFFDNNMFTEGYSKAAGDAISQLNKENKIFGYMNFLDYRIKSQYELRRNSEHFSEGFKERVDQSIEDLKQTKMEIENQIVLTDTKDGNLGMFFGNLRKGAAISVRKEIIQNNRLPKGWNDPKAPSYFSSALKTIEYLNTIEAKSAMKAYVKKKGIVKFKGMQETHQLELLSWENQTGKFRDIVLEDSLLPYTDAAKKMEQSVSSTFKYYAEKYKKFFDGSDWVMDGNRVQSLIHDKIRNEFMHWEANGNLGRLFLMKLMAPKSDPFTYTYFNGRISPAYKTKSLSMIKAVLNFIAKADDQVMLKSEKNDIFHVFAKGRNNIMRAHYGQRGDRGNWETDLLSTNENIKKDIIDGSPLLDDIIGWGGGIQEMELNPQIAALFGANTRSLAYNLSHQPLIPEMATEMANASYLSYMPMGYISNTVTPNRYPGISGWNSYNKAVQGDAMVLLGHNLNLRLLKNKVPNISTSPYKDISGYDVGPNKAGREAINDIILDKAERNCF